VRVFLDTNVLVSAFASRGLCSEIFELVLLDHDFVVGRNVLGELDRALRAKIKLSATRAAEIVDFVADEASDVDHAAPANADADAEDALVIGEALACRAQCFVTGDGALLRLARIDTLEILSPRQFWEALRARLLRGRPHIGRLTATPNRQPLRRSPPASRASRPGRRKRARARLPTRRRGTACDTRPPARELSTAARVR